MNRVLGVRRTRRGRGSSIGPAPGVPVLRWPSGRSSDGVFEMFSAGPENMLLVGASRSVASGTPVVQLSLVNTSPCQAVRLSVKLSGRPPTSVSGSVLTTPPMAAGDGFEPVDLARAAAFHGAVLKGRTVEVTVPARSVVVLTVR